MLTTPNDKRCKSSVVNDRQTQWQRITSYTQGIPPGEISPTAAASRGGAVVGPYRRDRADQRTEPLYDLGPLDIQPATSDAEVTSATTVLPHILSEPQRLPEMGQGSRRDPTSGVPKLAGRQGKRPQASVPHLDDCGTSERSRPKLEVGIYLVTLYNMLSLDGVHARLGKTKKSVLIRATS